MRAPTYLIFTFVFSIHDGIVLPLSALTAKFVRPRAELSSFISSLLSTLCLKWGESCLSGIFVVTVMALLLSRCCHPGTFVFL